MELVLAYKIVWNTSKDEGTILLNVENGVRQLHVDSATEATLLLDMLRYEKPVFVKENLLLTGFEPVGEGEHDQSPRMSLAEAAEAAEGSEYSSAYKITWNTSNDEGIIIVVDKEGANQLFVDSAAEGLLLMNLLRNEKQVNVEGNIIMTGFEKT